jgi:hypothetical protein
VEGIVLALPAESAVAEKAGIFFGLAAPSSAALLFFFASRQPSHLGGELTNTTKTINT